MQNGKGKGFKVGMHLTRWGMMALAVLIAFGGMGVSYACFGGGWGKWGRNFSWTSFAWPSSIITATSTNPCNIQFSNQRSNDSLILTDISEGDPAEPGTWTVGDINDPNTWTWSGIKQPEAKEVADIDCLIVDDGDVIDDDIDDIDDVLNVTINNGYPCYWGSIAFTLDNTGTSAAIVKGVTLVEIDGTAVSLPMSAGTRYYVDWETKTVSEYLNAAIHDFSIQLRSIAVDQSIAAGESIFGDIAIHVEQAASQNTTYTFRLKIDVECMGTQSCGTAYAYGGSFATCFYTINPKYPWGWTNGPLPAGHYEFPMYVGASDCLPSEEKLAGMLTIDYVGSTVTVRFDMYEDYTMDTTHLYVGNEILPRDKKGKFTVSPGQYPYSNSYPDGAQTDTYVIEGISGKIYIIGHSHTCWWE